MKRGRPAWAWRLGLPVLVGRPLLSRPCAVGEHFKCRHPSYFLRGDGCECLCHLEASFTCPRCGRRSWHPVDVDEGYCGACHDWTGERTRQAGDSSAKS
jgi:ribosomal protein L37E